MTPAHRSLLAAGLLWLAHAAPAAAQPVDHVFEGPNGPTVLQVDVASRPIVPPARPDLAGPAIPVAQVMNGGGFGLSGFNYYDDGFMEHRGPRRGARQYVLRPSWAARYGQD